VAARECPVSDEKVRRAVLAEPLEALPGTRETYSDLGFMMLGWILERLTGTDLKTLFLEKIVKPLELPAAGFRGIGGRWRCSGEGNLKVAATEDCPWRGRVLRGEVHDENGYLLGGTAGHAGLFSTAEDLDRIVLELFRGKKGRSGLFLAEGLHTFFKKPHPPSGGTWALGWDTPTAGTSTSGRYFSADSYGHTGFTGTSLWIDFVREISVILLTNRIHPSRENAAIRGFRPRVHDLVMEELLGMKYPKNADRTSGGEG
jgi:CubicO group peptidase (beta-lactamase class C family)